MIMILNAAQEAAVRHFTGPALIIAGPGSGKTAVITSRTKALIEQHKVPADKILVVTFSRKAAQNMKERFLCEHEGNVLPLFGTFHSLFFMILRNAYPLQRKNILTGPEKTELLKSASARFISEDEDAAEFCRLLSKDISAVRNGSRSIENFTSSSVPPASFRQIYDAYLKGLSESGLIDFDDMQCMTKDLFLMREDILRYWQYRFPFILIDEFQDISPIQYEIIRMLAGPGRNLFAVGDDDQSIYSFRGSCPSIMKAFLKDNPDSLKLTLTENYRCAPEILKSSLKVIGENKDRFQKDLVCGRKDRDPGTVNIGCFADSFSEYEYIAKSIRSRLDAGAGANGIAVLMRSSLELPYILHVFSGYRIPLENTPHIKEIFDHFIIRDLNSYLRLSLDLTEDRSHSEREIREDLFRILNKPSRFIPGKLLQSVFESGAKTLPSMLAALEQRLQHDPEKAEAVRRLKDDLKILKKCSPYAAVKYIRSAIGYDDYLKASSKNDPVCLERNLHLLDFLEAELLSHPERSLSALSASEESASETEDGIFLLTIHASKGLEFQHVYITDVNEGILPVKKAEVPAAIEEERRIFYVAMTRASSTLDICYCRKRGQKKAAPSRFLDCLLNDSCSAPGLKA